ncbi:MAG: transposase [Saprospiraceae bacterium]|nr:transposase [Saprospiraceae bacterium]
MNQLEQQNKMLIEKHNECIAFIENQIDALVNSDEELSRNSKLSQSIIGIGPIIDWYMIATTGNFKHFDTSRKYGGIAPFPKGSGTKKGKR